MLLGSPDNKASADRSKIRLLRRWRGGNREFANLVVDAMKEKGLSDAEARARCWFLDSKGLVVKSRSDLAEHKRPYAQDQDFNADPFSVINSIRPSAIIGVCGQTGIFTKRIFKRMAEFNDRPIIFALSNPTSKAECTAEDAYRLTNGRAVLRVEGPFAPVFIDGKKNSFPARETTPTFSPVLDWILSSARVDA